jgi:2-polyprenyl-6-methoxyphenol hydroxylase-like FAD-dependent oxidoreductase
MTDALRDAELLARAILDIVVGGAEERDALATYQRTRDTLSTAFFDLTDVIAGHRLGDGGIRDLLLRINAAMADELRCLHIAAQRSRVPVPPTQPRYIQDLY